MVIKGLIFSQLFQNQVKQQFFFDSESIDPKNYMLCVMLKVQILSQVFMSLARQYQEEYSL